MSVTALKLALLLSSSPSLGGPSAGTAYTLDQGEGQVGIFQPLSYGVGENSELGTHALLLLLMPNLYFKQQWWASGSLAFATRHFLHYPTGLYSVLAKEGVGGIYPENAQIPHILALDTDLPPVLESALNPDFERQALRSVGGTGGGDGHASPRLHTAGLSAHRGPP